MGAIKWGLLRHLNHEGVLVYSLREREHVRLLAEIRNSSFPGRPGPGVAGVSAGPGPREGPPGPQLGGVVRRGKAAQVPPWWLFDVDSPRRRVWNSFLALLTLYSVVVVPYRLGFRAEAQGVWYLMVRRGSTKGAKGG